VVVGRGVRLVPSARPLSQVGPFIFPVRHPGQINIQAYLGSPLYRFYTLLQPFLDYHLANYLYGAKKTIDLNIIEKLFTVYKKKVKY
jgi:hypothetical protein